MSRVRPGHRDPTQPASSDTTCEKRVLKAILLSKEYPTTSSNIFTLQRVSYYFLQVVLASKRRCTSNNIEF